MGATILIPAIQTTKILVPRTLVTGSPATITINLPASNCEYIRLMASLRSNAATLVSSISVTFNGDTGANYNAEQLLFNDATVAAARNNSLGNAGNGSIVGNSDGANNMSLLVVEIFNNKSSKFKTFRTVISGATTTNSNGVGQQTIGSWENTAEVTSIELRVAATTIADNSEYEVMGILAA